MAFLILDSVTGGSSGSLIQGNDIGTDYTGKIAVANSGSGIEIGDNNVTLGGTTSAARNIISGNGQVGVFIDSTASGTLVEGNFIGIGASSGALGNSLYGVVIEGSNNKIGNGTSAGSNSIADNMSLGVWIAAGSGNTISHNAIYANGSTQTGPGITLASGANNNLAAPTLSSASVSGTTLTVKGSFTPPTANVTYTLEFFASPSGDAEGKVYLATFHSTPTSTGAQSFTFTITTSVTGTDPVITATLSDATGDTSAFSNGVTVS